MFHDSCILREEGVEVDEYITCLYEKIIEIQRKAHFHLDDCIHYCVVEKHYKHSTIYVVPRKHLFSKSEANVDCVEKVLKHS